MKTLGKKFDLSRRTMLKHGIGVAVGTVAVSALAGIQPARAKASQAAAMYQGKPHGDKRCDGCSRFIPGTTTTADGTCQVVDGSISPQGWCALFAPKA
ncbi:MAG: high potential iron sulfur protein [Methylovirgula sp.]|jgi:hypothetical protein